VVSDGNDAAYDSPQGEATYDVGGDDGDRDDETDMQQEPTETQAEADEPTETGGKETVSKRRPVRDRERNQRLRKALRKSLAGQLHSIVWMTRIISARHCLLCMVASLLRNIQIYITCWAMTAGGEDTISTSCCDCMQVMACTRTVGYGGALESFTGRSSTGATRRRSSRARTRVRLLSRNNPAWLQLHHGSRHD